MGLRHLAPDVRHHHGVPGPGDVRSHRPAHVPEPDETDAAHGVTRPRYSVPAITPIFLYSSSSSRSCMATSMAPSRNFNRSAAMPLGTAANRHAVHTTPLVPSPSLNVGIVRSRG